MYVRASVPPFPRATVHAPPTTHTHTHTSLEAAVPFFAALGQENKQKYFITALKDYGGWRKVHKELRAHLVATAVDGCGVPSDLYSLSTLVNIAGGVSREAAKATTTAKSKTEAKSGTGGRTRVQVYFDLSAALTR